jgi:cell division control protein 45
MNLISIRWGIVGVTEQYILGKTERMRYLKEVELIAGHIGRICDSTINHDDENMSQSSLVKPSNTSTHLRIESEKE